MSDRRAASLLGATLELEVGAVATGGACVARHEGRVVFVRHALPGELVRAVVSEDRGAAFCRADAVEVLRASPQRVEPPCPHAGPGRCGGCDWQHASGDAQRAGKADVVREQFRRLADLDVTDLLTGVEELPGGLLGWRTRIVYAVDRDGRPGLHRHRSREVEHVDACPLGVPGVGDATVLADSWPGLTGVEVARGEDGDTTVLSHRPGPGRQSRGRRPPDRVRVLHGPATLAHTVAGHRFEVAAGGFWQVHPAAAEVLTAAVVDAVAPRPGETVLDLFAGAGALTAALARAVGPEGAVIGVESDRQAVSDAAANLADTPWAAVRGGRVTVESITEIGDETDADLVVLDPPRAGLPTGAVPAVHALAPRAIGYVSCDPATLARDVAQFLALGWELTGLRAFDAFPMTHHVECLATLACADADPPLDAPIRPGRARDRSPDECG